MKAQVNILEKRGAQLLSGVIVLVSVAALAVAFTAEHVFGVEPCILCVYQRVAYALAAVLGMLSIFARISPQTRTLLIASCGMVFLIGAAVALHQVGLQQHWWVGFTACGGGLPAEMSLAELKVQLTSSQPVRCDEVDWTLFGVSMAAYNTGLFLLLAVGSLWTAQKLLLAGGHAAELHSLREELASRRRGRRGVADAQAGEGEFGQPVPGTVKARWSPSVASILPRGIMPPIWRRASRHDNGEIDASPYREHRQHGPSSDW